MSTVIKDGAQIISKLKEGERPDVLLMDGFMPRLDALGVLREMDSMRLEKRPIVMVLSSTDNSRFESEVLNSGADYYFLKPYNPSMLAERVIQFASLSGSAAEKTGCFADNASDRSSRSHQRVSVSERSDNTVG